MKRFSPDEVAWLNNCITTAQDALVWASENLHPSVAKASSFGAEDSATIDMMVKINSGFRFFTLDTGRLPQQTHDVMARLREKYAMRLEVLHPDTVQVVRMVEEKGENLFYESVANRMRCCEVRKVNPTNRMLSTLDGWITGIRREQSPERSDLRMFEIDHQHGGILKINPIINWTWARVLEYIEQHDVPYNALIDQNYRSIGCEPCTRATKPGEDSRAGRWWWEQGCHKECGLHLDPKRAVNQ